MYVHSVDGFTQLINVNIRTNECYVDLYTLIRVHGHLRALMVAE